MNIPRFRHKRDDSPRPDGNEQHDVIQVDVEQLADVFSAPRWLRNLGLASWLLVGVAALVVGLIIEGLASLALGLSFAALSLFFLLAGGPSMRAWVNRHMGIEESIAKTITGNVIISLRRYFGGVSIVAAFNAVVVGIGAIAVGVPLAGTIAVVSFVTAYVPYVGAFVAGAFAVVLTLGSEGTTDASSCS